MHGYFCVSLADTTLASEARTTQPSAAPRFRQSPIGTAVGTKSPSRRSEPQVSRDRHKVLPTRLLRGQRAAIGSRVIRGQLNQTF